MVASLIGFAVLFLSCQAGAEINTDDLLTAAQTGNIKAARVLLDEGADINAKNSHGMTALMFAAMRDEEGLLEFLLDKGADVNATDNNGVTALMKGVMSAVGPDMVRLLLDKNADINAMDKNGRAAMYWALKIYRPAVTETLLAGGVDVNMKYKEGVTALMMAAGQGYEEVVNILLAKGAEVDAKTDNGLTSLMWAASRGRTDIIAVLAEKGADVNTVDINGNTVLINSIILGYAHHKDSDIIKSTVEVLLQSAAAVNVKNRQGKTALALAAERDLTGTVKLLKQHGATE